MRATAIDIVLQPAWDMLKQSALGQHTLGWGYWMQLVLHKAIVQASFLSGISSSCFLSAGVLPPELYRLTKLTILDLRHNKISGRIPPLYGRLTNLEQLWLQDNEIAGESCCMRTWLDIDGIGSYKDVFPLVLSFHRANSRFVH